MFVAICSNWCASLTRRFLEPRKRDPQVACSQSGTSQRTAERRGVGETAFIRHFAECLRTNVALHPQRRFKRIPPQRAYAQGILEAVEAIEDPKRLEQLHESAIRAESIEAFAQKL